MDEWPELHQVGDRWIEPCAGDGVLIDTVNEYRPGIRWTAVELRDTRARLQQSVGPDGHVFIDDVFALDFDDCRFDVCIMNPVFRLTMPFVEFGLRIAKRVVCLQRLNFVGSDERNAWMRANTPDCWVVPNRVSFSLGGKSDSVENAWHCWPAAGPVATFHVLGLTSLDERRQDRDRVRRAIGAAAPLDESESEC